MTETLSFPGVAKGAAAAPFVAPENCLLTLFDWSADRIVGLLDLAAKLKCQYRAGECPRPLVGRTLVQIYDKPSLRTRLSFSTAMTQLGGNDLFLTSQEAGLMGREDPSDVARVLGRMADAVVMRTFGQERVEALAADAGVPVVNGLTDEFHPCQALTDLLTLREAFGDDLSGRRIVFVGDGNNVSRSLAIACAKLGVRFTLCSPPDYEFDEAFLKRLRAAVPGARIDHGAMPSRAVAGADAIVTDVWASMGQEAQRDEKLRAFANYQVDASLMNAAADDAVFLHCLPAHRGEEVTAAVIDGPQSRVFDQAENRMHLARALFVELLT
ncbi:ornithine carbamoyltransferase [Alienimonas californiensis]|uniref:Ornithine carbamoyltransferase n=1 Tax=Alienimonas californiensis TaxID=2527989 RepID=A0A517PC34_9PLAN|nr:ornithine carbamoyltransferase [Alienimonas californiensis]QDT16945.1 Ornithine carbamoyltransferase [Alienimonas californiensis]